MKVSATNVLPGDIVRGIGLVVEYSEPETDFATRLEGYVSTRIQTEDGPDYVRDAAKVILPNDHQVNVRRASANYRLDLIGWVGEAFGAYGEHGNDDQLVGDLTKVIGRSRGIYADYDTTRHILGQLDENSGDPNAAFVDAYLDAAEGAFGTQEGDDQK